MTQPTKYPDAGEIVVVDFPGVTGTKAPPAVVLSSPAYHAVRPDVILGVITTQVGSSNTATDYILRDWNAAGLRKPSAFRAFVVTVPRSAITAHVGRLSKLDWQAVLECVQIALAQS